MLVTACSKANYQVLLDIVLIINVLHNSFISEVNMVKIPYLNCIFAMTFSGIMATQEEIIQNLRKKVEVLMSLYEKAKAERDRLREENKSLHEIVKTKEKEISKFEDKLNKVKLAKMIAATTEDSHEARLKINRIVREIDRCIGLLNK
jgi:septal ring factor EnvC (AmiA/AmiB activator)